MKGLRRTVEAVTIDRIRDMDTKKSGQRKSMQGQADQSRRGGLNLRIDLGGDEWEKMILLSSRA